MAILAITVGATLLAGAAGDTLGYDYLAYDAAARRLLDGQPLYDTSFAASGAFGLFYYPPPFILLVLPFALVPPDIATWSWIGFLLAAFLVGVALLPVSPRVRWLIVLAAAIQWPFVYALKLGQVGPLLFFLFAAGWRWIDRPGVLGSTIAAGALVKVQPVLMIGWAALAGRGRAALTAIIVGVIAVSVTTLITGVGAWWDFLDLVRRVSDPIATEKNLTPGAVAFQLGVDRGAAAAIQVVATAIVVVVAALAARGSSVVAGFLVAVIASQLVSPILWDHYAMLTLLPLAWLLERRHYWAFLGPVVMSIPLLDVTPAIGYLLVMVVALAAPWLLGRRRDEPDTAILGPQPGIAPTGG